MIEVRSIISAKDLNGRIDKNLKIIRNLNKIEIKNIVIVLNRFTLDRIENKIIEENIVYNKVKKNVNLEHVFVVNSNYYLNVLDHSLESN